jgi:hypothetical protein
VRDEALIVLVGGLGLMIVPVILAVARRKRPARSGRGDAGGAFMIDGGSSRDSDGGHSGSDGGGDGGGGGD